MTNHAIEVKQGKRFQFGKNWQNFLSHINEGSILQAENSLKKYLARESLDGLRFLDIGSGSGLFSLAAKRLGAIVHSFDYDQQSYECTFELKNRYFPNDSDWVVEQGSILDERYLAKLGVFDIVYSWGVLHHTGSMWQSLENAKDLVNDKGLLYIAIYNNQGGWSSRWKTIKKVYNKLPSFLKTPYALLIMVPREIRFFMISLVTLKPQRYFSNIFNYSKGSLRGMSYWHDLIDWVGGYPFEVAAPEDIFYFFKMRGFELVELKTVRGGLACNEFVFTKK